MNTDEIWAAVDGRRRALVDLVADLRPDEWAHPSLCEGWTVRDVVAHLTMPLLTLPEMLLLALRHPGGTNRLIRDGSIALARRYDTGELQRRLQRLVGYHRPVPGLTVRESLVDVLGHTLDITIPLGRDVPLPQDAVAEAADHVLSYGGRGSAKVFRALPLGGVRLVATDHAWSTGSGPVVSASMTDLFLLVIGRTPRLDALEGPGADNLRRALAAA